VIVLVFAIVTDAMVAKVTITRSPLDLWGPLNLVRICENRKNIFNNVA
jgi:hypothetical protein